MKFRTLFLILFLALVAAFVALNWDAIIAQTTLSLGFTTITAPLGLILLGLTVVLTVPLLAYAGFLHRSATTAAARNAEKLEAQRELADRAEASRFMQLREFLTEEFRKRAGRDEQLRTDVMDRLHQLEAQLHAVLARRPAEGETLPTKLPREDGDLDLEARDDAARSSKLMQQES